MKDFDEARRAREEADRSFRIGGEDFVYRPAVAPEAILSWSEFSGSADKEQAVLDSARAQLKAAEAQAAVPEAQATLASDPNAYAAHEANLARLSAEVARAAAAVEEKARPENEWLTVIDSTVLAIIEPGYHDVWGQVRNPDLPHPLSLGDLQELLEWLMEQVVNRPTGQPSGSSPLVGTTATSSTADSSSTADPESAPST